MNLEKGVLNTGLILFDTEVERTPGNPGLYEQKEILLTDRVAPGFRTIRSPLDLFRVRGRNNADSQTCDRRAFPIYLCSSDEKQNVVADLDQ